MRRPIILSVILFIAIVFLAVLYFRNLSTPGSRTTAVLSSIPNNAAFIFEFNNEDSFYEMYNGNKLFAAVTGKQQLDDLDTLRKQLLASNLLGQFFNGQDVFISFHPQKDNSVGLLMTTSADRKFDPEMLDKTMQNKQAGLKISKINLGYDVYSDVLKRHFYLVSKQKGVYAASFSKELIDAFVAYQPKKNQKNFILLPQQQTANSLANLYINYAQLNPLFDKLFKNKNSDIFKSQRLLPALGVLGLNFKSDALMFSGFTETDPARGSSYISLFLAQQPIVSELKNIFPSTTAYSVNFAVSDAKKFKIDLSRWQAKAGLQHEKDSLFNKIKTETGIELVAEFNKVLGNEFAAVTTRFIEKLAIVKLTDGSALRPVMNNISTMEGDEIGRFNYNKLPFFLLGDAFSMFNHPWFMIVDNYLVLANSKNELVSYRDSYFNSKFQSKQQAYNEFDKLQTGRSNVNWFINFKNSQAIFKRDMNDNFYKAFSDNEPGWKNFYGASYQLSASDKNFYTVFCMNFNQPDTASANK
ncbi:hypothetical protein ACFQZS_14865 [Mucilaginibacter calamicampi]|uniref:DUF3352 domain-containing protein n=1 Tax=Mucilaginibacter calamicampi TaxID=1302352 RepID=A0ABW2Z3Z0_9SPHI